MCEGPSCATSLLLALPVFPPQVPPSTLPTVQDPMSSPWDCQPMLQQPRSRAAAGPVSIFPQPCPAWPWAPLNQTHLWAHIQPHPCGHRLGWWNRVWLARPVYGNQFILVPHIHTNHQTLLDFLQQ